ncbi:MAG: DUF1997 domain-containing protein [Microcoleaceae cyanobacterium]
MKARFTASQSVQITVPDEQIPIQHYLRQPRRLVNALCDPRRLEQLSDDCFRLKMRPLSFMFLTIQPTVDMKIWALSDNTIRLKSVACEVRGVEYINQRFRLQLYGRLSPRQVDHQTQLQGVADLAVEVELPPPLLMTPRPLLEATGNQLLKSVLLTIKQRLMHNLVADYQSWARKQELSPAPCSDSALPASSS